MNTTTNILKKLRTDNKKHQKDIAQKLGMSQSAYSKLENNPDNVTLGQLKQLTKIYDVELKALLGIGDKYKEYYDFFRMLKQLLDKL